jgi:superoxide dismutase, Fe-Mn family
MGMSSSGYLWFVTDQSGATAIIPTFGAGTLLVRSRQQQTPVGGLVLGEGLKTKGVPVGNETQSNPDPVAASVSGPSATSPTSGHSHFSPPLNPHSSSRAFHARTSSLADFSLSNTPSSIYSFSNEINLPEAYHEGARFDLTTLGETLFPLFCISVHERAWISAGYGVWGKEEWLNHFWTVLDWNKVSEAYVKWVKDPAAQI